MNIIKSIFQILVIATTIVGVIFVSGSVFAAKVIDETGDKLHDKLNG